MMDNTITLGGRVIAVAPLNIKALKVVGPRLAHLNGTLTAESLDTMVDALWYGAMRLDPSITREFIEEELDVPMLTEAVALIDRVNNLVARGAPSGEVQPGQ